jgi:rubrerythrin
MDDILKESLNTALDMEHSGHDLYVKAANKTSNKLGKITLEAIAEKELDHIKAINDFAKKNLNKAIADIRPKDKKNYIKPIMEKLEKALNENVKPDSDLNEAYKVALELEKNSYDLYKELKQKSSGEKEKEFFDFLMSEENTHFELLSETLEYLNNPKDWYKEKEQWLVEF